MNDAFQQTARTKAAAELACAKSVGIIATFAHREPGLPPGSYSGTSGVSGFSGMSGSIGLSGLSGYSSYSGISGVSGASGYSGQSGQSGWSGCSGFSGTSGYSGLGLSGQSGVSGTSGWSGISYKTILLSAAGGWASNTSGCSGPTKTESATNKVNVWTLDFANGSKSYAEWNGYLPANYVTNSTLTAMFVWFAAGTSTNSVVWGLEAGAYADGVVLDTALGAAAEVTDAHMSTANTVQCSAATSAITIAGSNPTAGDMVHFRAYRKGSGSDNLAVPASLVQVIISY